ncbi:MAG: hypothetical protein Q8K56_00850 [Rhodoglobus sp.]|nr:hypothetical protein [Rhodoglobus sp.]
MRVRRYRHVKVLDGEHRARELGVGRLELARGIDPQREAVELGIGWRGTSCCGHRNGAPRHDKLCTDMKELQ